MIEVEAVSKSFPVKGGKDIDALRSVSVSIGDNEFFTLLGPSGCGKTTLLRLIAGFEAPSSGQITLDGKDVAGLPPQKRPVNTVFQSYALFPHMSVAANVAFGLEMLGVAKAEIGRRVRDALDMVKLGEFGARMPAQLSGGQQQRVALARALAPKPRVLLLDEPLSALDLKLRKQMQSELKRLQGETGIAFVLVTHDQEEALAMSDRIAVMRDGNILQVGRAARHLRQPGDHLRRRLHRRVEICCPVRRSGGPRTSQCRSVPRMSLSLPAPAASPARWRQSPISASIPSTTQRSRTVRASVREAATAAQASRPATR